jgi:methyl-accepting chemotaxis protein
METAAGENRRHFFADLAVGTKILGAVGIAALVALVVGLSGLYGLSRSNASAQHIYHGSVASIEAVGDVKQAIAHARLDAINQVLAPTDALTTKYMEAFDTDITVFEKALAEYRASGPTGDPALVDQLETTWQSYTTLVRGQLFPLGQSNDMAGWIKLRDARSLPLTTAMAEQLTKLDAAERADAAASAATSQSEYERGRTLALSILVAGLLLALGMGFYVARRIRHELLRVKDVCDALAAGDLTHSSGLTSGDEPGQMGRALDTAIVRLRETVGTIEQSATSLAGATDELTGTATRIAASAGDTTERAGAVSEAADQISRSVDTVSAGSDEMGAAIREISENASLAAQVAADAVAVAAATSSTMNKLGDSSAEIGNVVKVITSIAAQTNLLALNATIEAARAGDAGKGFAVVASEVKDLAQETAKATEDIARRVEAIQADTAGAVAAIDEISEVIARISDFQTTIASAVEEQTATTAEMTRSVGEAAAGSLEIARSITGVAQAAHVTSEGVDHSRAATAELARMSSDLRALVGVFKV